MEEPMDQTAIMIKRLQEREQEQMVIQSVCTALSSIVTKADFAKVVNSILKEQFLFDDFVLASSNESETEYHIFYQATQKYSESIQYPLQDGFFDTCRDTADSVAFDLKSANDKKNPFPEYINSINKKGSKHAIGIGLPYSNGNSRVLLLFFKNPQLFSRESHRILKGIITQLSITIRNINMTEAYENRAVALKSHQNKPTEKEETQEKPTSEGFYGIVGNSDAMQKVYEGITQVATSSSTVLITGETGTGKERVAAAIHHLSSVADNQMIKVNCASIPVNLIESELFGHEKGAFTGATDVRIGKFESAHGGTIFLDEIGELPLELQGKLLRVLQEKQIERIGGKTTIKVNARVIAATNRSLEKEVAEGRFRSDLYYRLNVFPIPLPTLRDRKEDIPVLSRFFLEKHIEKTGKKIKGFSKKVLNSMMAYEWPGNVRELENMIERSILLAQTDTIKEMSFPEIFKTTPDTPEAELYTKTLKEVEKEHILKVIRKCNGRISGPQGAAVLLGLPGTTLISKMQKLGIKKEHFSD